MLRWRLARARMGVESAARQGVKVDRVFFSEGVHLVKPAAGGVSTGGTSDGQ